MMNHQSQKTKPGSPVALVTGGAGGLGSSLVLELDRLGYRVAIHYNRSSDAAQALLGKLENEGVAVQCDVAVYDEVARMRTEIADRLGPIDVLINNAAIRRDQLMAMQTPESWRSVIDTNLIGTFNASRVCLPHMLRQRWGRIVNIVSPSGLIATAGQTAYSASKAGVIGMTRTLAAECGRRGVTVNALSPGFMPTQMTDDLPEQVRRSMMEKLPIPRFSDGDEIAAGIGFFLDNAYMTGQVVSVDGGVSIT